MPLSNQQRNELRIILDNRYNALIGELQADRIKAGTLVSASDLSTGADDRLAASQATGIADAELGRDWHELQAVQSALARLDTGDYGTCTDCSRPIPWKRLERTPAASRCVECQKTYERGLKSA
jgi:DnaK suppressor protein